MEAKEFAQVSPDSPRAARKGVQSELETQELIGLGHPEEAEFGM